MTLSKAECGRLGGLQTFLRHGVAGMAGRGKLGGRPKALTLETVLLRQSQLREQEEKQKEEEEIGYPRIRSLARLQRLWLNRQKSTAGQIEWPEVGVAGNLSQPLAERSKCMSNLIIANILRKEHNEAGLTLWEDEDFVYLKQEGVDEPVATFSAKGLTVDAILRAADEFVEWRRSGVRFAEAQP